MNLELKMRKNKANHINLINQQMSKKTKPWSFASVSLYETRRRNDLSYDV